MTRHTPTCAGAELGRQAPHHLTEAEAARFLRLCTRTLQRYRAAGTGPRWMRLGKRRIVYSKDALQAWARGEA